MSNYIGFGIMVALGLASSVYLGMKNQRRDDDRRDREYQRRNLR